MQIIHKVEEFSLGEPKLPMPWPCTQQIRDLYRIGLSMCKGFKFGSEVSNVDVKFWTKGINMQKILRYANDVVILLQYLICFEALKNRANIDYTHLCMTSHFKYWVMFSKTKNAWSYYRYYGVLHYARVYFHIRL